ncbi:hypothetical protein SAMN05444682_107316 [Parapedobacter indicus]|uniref:Uncharacterized protein n=1 Tax=Parapedobacter indicus TaxID=1477437 RepID=A0A1I3NUS0_9SPHI|nr:hypothetical protein CLV26_107317 [Parapedobacter indicus]SFJ12949.1 hypothetical protein SAMN05444682_107316 [Parapedobacter indicus]
MDVKKILTFCICFNDSFKESVELLGDIQKKCQIFQTRVSKKKVVVKYVDFLSLKCFLYEKLML